MPNDLDKQVRTAIGEIISAAAPDAKVYPWNVLDHDPDDWPGLFRTDDGLHGWVIRRRQVESSWKNLGRRDHRFPEYDVVGFYKFRSGKLGDNSDDEVGEICDAIYEAFKERPTLDLPIGIVEKHDLLQFAVITTTRPGEETMHFAHGRLKVYLCC